MAMAAVPRVLTMAWIFAGAAAARAANRRLRLRLPFRPPPSGGPPPSHCRWLDHRRDRRARQRFKQPDAKSRASSSGESDCRPSSKGRRRPGNPCHRQPVFRTRTMPLMTRRSSVLSRSPGWFLQQRPNGSPLRFAEPKSARHDPSPPNPISVRITDTSIQSQYLD